MSRQTKKDPKFDSIGEAFDHLRSELDQYSLHTQSMKTSSHLNQCVFWKDGGMYASVRIRAQVIHYNGGHRTKLRIDGETTLVTTHTAVRTIHDKLVEIERNRVLCAAVKAGKEERMSELMVTLKAQFADKFPGWTQEWESSDFSVDLKAFSVAGDELAPHLHFGWRDKGEMVTSYFYRLETMDSEDVANLFAGGN